MRSGSAPRKNREPPENDATALLTSGPGAARPQSRVKGKRINQGEATAPIYNFLHCRRSATVPDRTFSRGPGAVPRRGLARRRAQTLFVLTRCLESRGALIVLSDMLTQPILDGATPGTLLAAALSRLAGVRARHRSPAAAGTAEHGRREP